MTTNLANLFVLVFGNAPLNFVVTRSAKGGQRQILHLLTVHSYSIQLVS